MERTPPKLPAISKEELTPLVLNLLEIISQQQEQLHWQQEQIQALKDEIARLKGQKPRPEIKPSKLEREPAAKGKRGNDSKRPGSAKRKKTRKLKIHKTVVIRPEEVPEGSRFKGYQDFTVQDIVLRPHNTRYRLQRWQTPEGRYIVAQLPAGVSVGHLGATLVSFILYQYYHAHVTQPLILEQLWDFGVDISSGQINRIITEGKECFHAEKEDILRVGLEVSGHVHVDDTGARHQGKTGYCTHIGNELFAWFKSTSSKSRVNFLEILRGEEGDYLLSDDALDYMCAHKLSKSKLEEIAGHHGKRFEDKEQWEACLAALGVTRKQDVRIATEGALLGSVLSHGINSDLAIVSDDAGQFDVLRHALCWIHAERTIVRLVGFSDLQRKAIASVRKQIWNFYKALKAYQKSPSARKKTRLERRFDTIFKQKTSFVTLNSILEGIHKNKSELLLVLERPDIPLHNNLSERDIREYVKKRKISGSTRSDLGRRCRDTFTSLKKTCRKLGVSFWLYLKDRVSGSHNIALLPEMIRQRALEAKV